MQYFHLYANELIHRRQHLEWVRAARDARLVRDNPCATALQFTTRALLRALKTFGSVKSLKFLGRCV